MTPFNIAQRLSIEIVSSRLEMVLITIFRNTNTAEKLWTSLRGINLNFNRSEMAGDVELECITSPKRV